MALAAQYRRLVVLTSLLVLALAALGYRLYDLQVLRHETLLEAARDNTQRTFLREPRRGDILDARGNLLATSKRVRTVCADPTLIGTNQAAVARAIAPILKMSPSELAERLRLRTWINDKGQTNVDKYVVLKRKIEEEDWQRIVNAMKEISFGVDESKLPKRMQSSYHYLRQRAIFVESDQLRVYPNAALAAHVLGYVGVEEQATRNGRVPVTIGRDGIEFTLNSVLTGVQGWCQTETDSRRREIVSLREQDVAPRSGLNAVLTLDAGLQHIVESELAVAMQKHTPISATAVAVRPRTGEILALANLPNFDPNKPGAVPADYRRNRVISDLAEPGSTFKIVVVSAALNERTVGLEDVFDCERGHFYFAGRLLRDHAPYGLLTVLNIITKSSNIGAAKIGIKLGSEHLYEYMRHFGFGQRTGLPLLGEISGIVHPLPKWTKLSISRIPMGHEVAVTPLQMAMAMCAIANGGLLMRPVLVDRLEDDQGQVIIKYSPQPVRRVISEAAATQMVTALKSAVATNGTGTRARLDHYMVAGKTGTAQKAGPGGYQTGKYFSSFIGFFPADDPELCISVVLDEPQHGYYGGETAAPVFRNIAERAGNYLAIRPQFRPAETVAAAQITGAVEAAAGQRQF
ncbi:MAG: penicillin-binding protein 2 [Verrucomicrobiota bacterium]